MSGSEFTAAITRAGRTMDATDDLRALYDIAIQSMDFGSGFLDASEVDALRRIQEACGFEPFEYPGDKCTCGHERQMHSYVYELRGDRGRCRFTTYTLASEMAECPCQAFDPDKPPEAGP